MSQKSGPPAVQRQFNLTLIHKSKTNYQKIYTVQRAASWDDLSTGDLLQGDIPHVFYHLPDVRAFHSRYYYTTSG